MGNELLICLPGGNVNATAIQSRLKRLRKMAVDSGINKYAASQEGSSPAKANGRALAGNKKTSTNRKRGGMLNDDARYV